MINILEQLKKIKDEGYNEEYAEAKLCQDIILLLLSKSRFSKNITIKGGVAMRCLSNDARRATLDLDFDLIRYPLTAKGLKALFGELSGNGIKIKTIGKIENLKHQDYQGKRVNVLIKDEYNNSLTSKIDIGVHKYLELDQLDYCLELREQNDKITFLINSKEQIFAEKLKSLLRFGPLSTRFKDIFDMYYLLPFIDRSVLAKVIKAIIIDDSSCKEQSVGEIASNVEHIFNNKLYLSNLNTSNKNWLDVNNELVLKKIVNFLKRINEKAD